ncbi:MAG: hypothetical protein ACRDTT_16635 [Pseudonocardiaceae bacterium]
MAVLDEDTLRALPRARERRDLEARRDTTVIRLFVGTGARWPRSPACATSPTSTSTPVSSGCWQEPP